MPKRVSPEIEREIRRLAARGPGLREIGRLVHRSHHAVTNALAREPKSTPVVWNPSPARLSLAEREEIRVGLERGDTFTAIAALIGRAVSIVSREVAANSADATSRASAVGIGDATTESSSHGSPGERYWSDETAPQRRQRTNPQRGGRPRRAAGPAAMNGVADVADASSRPFTRAIWQGCANS